MKKIVYVTGCLGFIGSEVTRQCLECGWYVIGVDKGTYASNWNFLDEFKQHANFKFIHEDINDLDRLLDCDYVINTAAETHVDNSIESSDIFVKSNVNGVHHLLKLIAQKQSFSMPVLLHFSTDEVYGDIVKGAHVETDMLKPSNPYSATKAAADMLICAWARTFNVPYVIVRPTNNYGIGQYTEKFIPKSIKHLLLGRPIALHDAGLPKRTWLHVGDTASAVIAIIRAGVQNEIYNIAGNHEEQNIVVAKQIIDLFFPGLKNNYDKYLNFDITRPGQDVRYSINDDKLRSLGWLPQANFDQELAGVVDYYSKTFVW